MEVRFWSVGHKSDVFKQVHGNNWLQFGFFVSTATVGPIVDVSGTTFKSITGEVTSHFRSEFGAAVKY